MDLYIKNRHALIIGAGHGLGACLSKKLLHEGVHVCGVARRQQSLEDLYSSTLTGNLLTYAVDLSYENSEKQIFSYLEDKNFQPDIIIHCMGINASHEEIHSLVEYNRDLYRMIFEVPLLVNEEYLPSMRKNKWGRIVFTGSVASLEAQGPVSYCTFKAMLAAYCRSAGRQEAANGVIMSAVLPGAFRFSGNNWDNISHTNSSFIQDFLQNHQRIGRFGNVEELTDFMLFLCSEQASFNAGGIYPVDGGLGTAYLYE